MIKLGIDIGSTTAKAVAINEEKRILFTKYERHNTKVKERIIEFLSELKEIIGTETISINITGTIGLGVAERCKLPFLQEVVAAAKAISTNYRHAKAMIDIGGEDAKVVFFNEGETTDLRMNGNCAGGTGAFIDQMAIILGVTIPELNELALKATELYPIAARCGVFSKTDIQNLVAKNVSRENIAASIFRAVAVQTVVTLAHGSKIDTPVLLCGGPLTYIPALRKAFVDYLAVTNNDIILPENGTLMPALGCALYSKGNEKTFTANELIEIINKNLGIRSFEHSPLPKLFANSDDYSHWKERISCNHIPMIQLKEGIQEAFLGIDSGSTTTKIVLLDKECRMLYSDYLPNQGTPIATVEKSLKQLAQACKNAKTELKILGSYSTGYGEDLIRTAFQLHGGIIETIAHYMAALHLDKEVSFILDIGGQDMKAIFVNNGIIDRMEINEACSSGCGSFIETFAKSLGYTAAEFAENACHSAAPSDLGTRCTVFMNSKVKQELRDGANADDIAAGLSYSVVKNCLYKVLKLKDASELGKHIVVQGGTMRNNGVVRALELETDTEIKRFDKPELMGAFGCALYAMQHRGETIELQDILAKANYRERLFHCKGCDNQCLIVDYKFQNGKSYFSGNKCEKIYTNGSKQKHNKLNTSTWKYKLLFERDCEVAQPALRIGIPRVLNMYEEYPFWHALLKNCGIEICLSDGSTFRNYEKSVKHVMADNICFPAKLVHSHIQNLIDKKVNRIFMPFVVHEQNDGAQNSYNCPIVTGYSEVIKSVHTDGIIIDSPTISFRDEKLLYKQCETLLQAYGIMPDTIKVAFKIALEAQKKFVKQIVKYNKEVLEHAEKNDELVIMLGCRPYHIDPVIQHKVSDMLSDMGVHVMTDDYVRDKEINLNDVHYLSQWFTTNKIIKAAKWCATQESHVQYVQLTSFGCGPDAFLNDEIRNLMLRYHKAHTVLKLDDINNIGSMKLRVRSMIESLKLVQEQNTLKHEIEAFQTVPIYDEKYKGRKILAPFFTPFLSPIIPAMLELTGYEAENLPMSDKESSEWGLKYANNEICYPATLIVGDVIKAFKSGAQDPNKCVIGITQTGGQCRASNYISLIKKGLIDAGYEDVPVISFTFGGGIENNQPAFQLNWFKLIPYVLRGILYTDCIGKFYHASIVREKREGAALELKDKYLELAANAIRNNNFKALNRLLAEAVEEFNDICLEKESKKVGIVGEIYLKFNPHAQQHVTDWLITKEIEVVPPVMLDFFTQSFVNHQVRVDNNIKEASKRDYLMKLAHKIIRQQVRKTEKIAKEFKYYMPYTDIEESAKSGAEIINLNTQFGEGWLLPAEIVNFAKHGVNNVVSLQPFGCIANQIVSKGVFKRIKTLYPQLNLLSLDFDSGVSDVNITNRMLLFLDQVEK